MGIDLSAAVKATEDSNVQEQNTETNVESYESQRSGNQQPIERKPIRDDLGRSYATGKRKDSVARVWIKPGSGKIVVNGRDGEEYVARPVLWMMLNQPFGIANCENQFDVHCTVKGGGLTGQAGAIRHGISQALVNYDPAFRPPLKKAGFMTRDSRVVERKKYGRAKARRSFQFSKR